ncbi:band 4.1-like protein 4A isoform X2 [Cheilinus undulatus]|uniref:band 4.1-like protein 4A isoform X2 n=1 Tax=Cheilinus undulatus TaxID=241271 RepID=UPI001BD42172|nr:band 4.1-like protein 4A isoform X2 [Cheilinus undulatus]
MIYAHCIKSCLLCLFFFRMSESDPETNKLKQSSISLSLQTLDFSLRKKNIIKKPSVMAKHYTNRRASVTSESIVVQTAPAAVQRSEGGNESGAVRPSAPWETSGPLSGLYNPKFPPNTKEEESQDRGQRQRRSRSLDGDRPIREQDRRSRSHGNTSSESENSNRQRRKRGSKTRCSPDAQTWKHIRKQLVEPTGSADRKTEEIPFMEVRVSGEPMRRRHPPRGRKHRQWVSASDLESQMVPPLPISKATVTSCG